MTSYVEFHGHGFWCQDTVLRDWVREVVAVVRTTPDAPPWLRTAADYWDAIACAAKSIRSDLRLQADVTDPARQAACAAVFERVAARPLPPPVKRAATLAAMLVRGELAGEVPTDLEYWADDEWLSG